MKLESEAIKWGVEHVQRFWVSDFFPHAVSREALRVNAQKLTEALVGTDISTYGFTASVPIAVPKATTGFRIAHDLNPIDAIVYASAVYSIADAVEAARKPIEERIACSYRIQPDSQGNFFSERAFDPTYSLRLEELGEKYKFVLHADLADYYNKIYLHRLANNIGDACGSSIGDAFDDMLMNMSNGTSQGIPVGPIPSIVLAEANLIDVDNWLADWEGIEHCRYVDDFRIFCNDKVRLTELHAAFVEFLYSVHRLSLSSAKSLLESTESYRESQRQARVELVQLRHNHLTNVTGALGNAGGDLPPYQVPQAFLEEQQGDDDDNYLTALTGETKPDPQRLSDFLAAILREMVVEGRLNLGLARRVVNLARRRRLRGPLPMLLDNFDFFCPILKEVVLYMDKCISNTAHVERLRPHILKALSADSIQLPFVKKWFGGHIARLGAYAVLDEAISYVKNIDDFEVAARYARTAKLFYWVRSHRANFDQLNPQERRSLLMAATILTKNELSPWLHRLTPRGVEEQLLVGYIRSVYQ